MLRPFCITSIRILLLTLIFTELWLVYLSFFVSFYLEYRSSLLTVHIFPENDGFWSVGNVCHDHLFCRMKWSRFEVWLQFHASIETSRKSGT